MIVTSACGPTCIAMVASGLTGRNDITPTVVANYSKEHDFMTEEFQVNGFFFCQDIYDYGTIHRALEFLFTLSDFGKEVARIGSEGEELSQPYVIKFKARRKELKKE